MVLCKVVALLVGYYLITCAGGLPSACLTSLTTSNSVQCCKPSPFLEISFNLTMGCDVPHHLDEGVRLEISTSDGVRWEPIRYYTPTLDASNISLVTLNEDNATVKAQALHYTSNFSFEVVQGSQPRRIREYVCDGRFLNNNVQIRWMQRYSEASVTNVSTWSLDDVKIVLWNGQCRQVLLSNTFDDTMLGEDMLDILSGIATILPCDLAGGNQLYFREKSSSILVSRRSLVIRSLPVYASDCPNGSMNDVESCTAQGCSPENRVCSIGSVQCAGCYAPGYRIPPSNTVGPCLEPPTVEPLTTELSTRKLPTTELLTTELSTTELSTTELPTTELPTTEPLATELSTTEPLATELSTTELPTTKALATESPTTELPAISMVYAQNVLRSLSGNPDLPLAEVANRLKSLVLGLIHANITADRQLSQLFLKTVDNVLSTSRTKTNASQVAVSSILSILDTFALRVYDENEPELEANGFRLRVINVNVNSGRVEGISQGANKITIPALGDEVKVASLFFKDLSKALPDNPLIHVIGDKQEREMIPVISSSVLCRNCSTASLSDPVQYQLSVDTTMDERNSTCFFYDLQQHIWSRDGCQVNAHLSNSTVVVCECTHLTHFAILLSSGLNTTSLQEFQLQVIGYVGTSISFVFLLLTIFTLSLLKSLWGMRNFIHVNLCVSLFVAQFIFVTAVDKSDSVVACQWIAIVLHYVFLVTFMWMLMEGVVLYVVLVQVFVKRQRLYMFGFFLVSYGVPLIYMFIVVPLGLVLRGPDNKPHYGYTACWLRYDTWFVWAFIAPVILIILANVGFFIMAVYIMKKHTKRQTKSHLKSISQWIKSSVVLMISMGIPWIVGVLILSEDFVFLAYIYVIFVSFQGLVIFILFVPLSKQVREGYRKWWKGKVSQSEFLSKHLLSSDMDKKSSTLGRFSSIKTSTLRISRGDKSTFRSSHTDENHFDIKLPESLEDKKSLSPSPPPGFERYIVQSQTVVPVGSVEPEQDSIKNPKERSNECLAQNGSVIYKGTEVVNGFVITQGQSNGTVGNDQTQLSHCNVDHESMTEEKTIKFSDSISNINDCKVVEGTSL